MTHAPAQGSAAWVDWRRGGIGASDLPAIMGEDPWRSEYELALEKRGLVEQEPTNEAQAWGHRVQRSALDLYAETRGLRVRNVNTTVVSRRYPHVYASLDGRVVGERRGVEVKLTGHRWDDGPPRRVLIQTQAQMGVCGLDSVDVVKVGMHYSAPDVYTVERDDLLIHELLPLAQGWYERFVLGDEMPPIDGSRAASRYLDQMEGEPEMLADPDQASLAARLQAIRRTLAAAEAEEAEVVNRLKESMVGSYALVGHGFRVAWKPSKPRTTTDWQAVAAAYRRLIDETLLDLDAIESLHTATGKAARPFRVTFEEGS